MANQSLKLSEARLATPAATGAAGEWVTQIGEAMREAVTAADVTAIMQGVVTRAKAGDAKAIKQVLDFVGQAALPRPQLVVGIRGSVSQHGPNGHASKVVADLTPADQSRLVRRDCAQVLGRDGALPAAILARRAGYAGPDVEAALAAAGPGVEGVLPLFDRDGERWRLTTAGRQELLGGHP